MPQVKSVNDHLAWYKIYFGVTCHFFSGLESLFSSSWLIRQPSIFRCNSEPGYTYVTFLSSGLRWTSWSRLGIFLQICFPMRSPHGDVKENFPPKILRNTILRYAPELQAISPLSLLFVRKTFDIQEILPLADCLLSSLWYDVLYSR